MGMDFSAGSAGEKKKKFSLCSPQGMVLVDIGQDSGGFSAVGDAVVAFSTLVQLRMI